MHQEVDQLARMVGSTDPAERLRSLRLMREQIAAGRPPGDHLALARSMILDADSECRWQALIVVGDSILSDPDAVWDVICEFGASEDEDMRIGVAALLLEHLLEHHFDIYFPRLKARIERGSGLLVDTLSRCWPFGQAESRWRKVRALMNRSRKKSRG